MDLISAIRDGDELSYSRAYREKREKVYFYFLKKTHAEEDAKDLLQMTFLKLWQYRHTLSEHYTLDQHLFSIARTVYIDHLRQQSKYQKVQAAAVTMQAAAEEVVSPVSLDQDHQLQQALSKLPEIRKHVFVLHRLKGYSYKEVAEQLSISVKSVDNHLAKAIKQLKRLLIFLGMALLLWR